MASPLRIGPLSACSTLGAGARGVAIGGGLGLAQDQPLVDEALEGLGRAHQAAVEQDLVPEAAVEEVEDGVLGPADVQVDRQPVLLLLRVPGAFGVLGVDIPQVVPARPGPLGHRVDLATVRLGVVDPLLRLGERRLGGAGRLEVVEVGEEDGQLVLADGGDAVLIVQEHRERLAPVALAGEQPVAELVVHGLLADAPLGEPGGDGRLGLGGGLAVQDEGIVARLDRDALVVEDGGERAGVGLVGGQEGGGVGGRLLAGRRGVGPEPFGGGLDDGPDGDAEGLRELEVAVVVGGHGHDGAGAVADEDVVGDPDRDGLAGDGVDRVAAGEDAGLGLGQVGAVQVALARGLLAVLRDGVLLLRRGDAVDQRVLRGQHHVRRAEEGVGAGGVDPDDVLGGRGGEGARGPGRGLAADEDGEVDLRALAAADPVALHVADRLRPVDDLQVLDQAVAVGGDPEHPLGQRHADDGVVPALGLAVDDLLVRQHGAERRAPVDGDLGAVGQALRVAVGDRVDALGDREFGDGPALAAAGSALGVGPLEVGVVPGVVDLEEDPLRPLVVAGIRGVDLAGPVVGEAQRLDLAAEVVDVGLGGDPGVGVGLDGVLLGGEAEGVPSHRVQDVEALHPLEAADDVGGGVPLGVADVQPRAAGVGEHVEDVELGPPAVEVGGREGLVLLPVALPLGLDPLRVIRGHGSSPARRGAPRPFRTRLDRPGHEKRPAEFPGAEGIEHTVSGRASPPSRRWRGRHRAGDGVQSGPALARRGSGQCTRAVNSWLDRGRLLTGHIQTWRFR